jgi:arylformamidase
VRADGTRGAWVDISTPLAPGMAGFPCDPAFGVQPLQRIGRGDPYNLSLLSLGSHSGTHVDPPSHFIEGATTADQLDLEILNGPCVVRRIDDAVRRIGAAELGDIAAGTTRLLLRTSNSARWQRSEEFFPDYVAIDESAAERLLGAGVRLLGIDSLSMESDPSGRFPVHHRLLGAGVLILEGLRLHGIRPGRHELRCLPLRWTGGDGAPARALLGVV